MTEPVLKKVKTSDDELKFLPTCKHYVSRKKRFCKMTVAKGREYCGEHELKKPSNRELGFGQNERIDCPLDPKHTVYANKLKKHLKICNARPRKNPQYIQTNINLGTDDEEEKTNTNIKLTEVDEHMLRSIIDKINNIYDKYVDGKIEEMILDHEILKDELSNPAYGATTLKHLKQTSSILGHLNSNQLLKDDTCFIEFGAGKGQVSFWLAQVMKLSLTTSVLLIDKASHRHKKDNKIEDKTSVSRIRADIADLNINNLNIDSNCKSIVAVSKHLCGAATDLTLRCIVNGNKERKTINHIKTEGIFIALCCHHRCNWRSFVGKSFFLENGINKNAFEIITKMVSWAICGTGMSREKRLELKEKKLKILHSNENSNSDSDSQNDAEFDQSENLKVAESTIKLTREERSVIGLRCKRVIDFARLNYLKNHNYDGNLKYYVKTDVTLENTCLVVKILEA